MKVLDNYIETPLNKIEHYLQVLLMLVFDQVFHNRHVVRRPCSEILKK